MKVSLQQITLAAANGTLNITDPAITSDWKGAIFFGGQPTANATTTGGFNYSIGACDAGGRNVCFSGYAQDATSAASCGVLSSATFAWTYASATAQQTTLAYSAAISNGVTVTQASTGGAQHLVNVLMFAGADVEFAVSSASFATSSSTITHNLTGTPDCVIVLSNTSGSSLFDDREPGGLCVGFYDGTNSIGFGAAIVSAANPTNVAARCGTANMGEDISQTPADLASLTISSVGSSTLTISSGGSNRLKCVVIAWRHLSFPVAAAAAFVNTTSTVTGNNTVNTGMAVAPQLWLSLPTRLTSTAFTNSDAAGSWGFCAAVNNAGATQQASISGSFENAVSASSVAKTYISNTTASQTLSDTGTVAFASTITSWNSDGITENVGTAGSSAFERINLAYGIAPISDSLLAASNTDLVTHNSNWTYTGESATNFILVGTTGAFCNNQTGGNTVNAFYAGQFTADQQAQCTLASLLSGTTTTAGVGVRYSNGAVGPNGYIVLFDSGHYNIVRLDNGAFTSISGGPQARTNNNGDVVLLQAQGNAITLTINGSTVKTVTDSTYAAGSPGIAFGGGHPSTVISTFIPKSLGIITPAFTINSIIGHLGDQVSPALTQQTVTTASSSTPFAASLATSVSGLTASFVEGQLVNVINITGQSANFTEGSLTTSITSGATIPLSAQSAGFSVGLLANGLSYVLDQGATVAVLFGQTATFTEGLLSVSVGPQLAAVSSLGTVGIPTVSLTLLQFSSQTVTSTEGVITLSLGNNVGTTLGAQTLASAEGLIGCEVDYFPSASTATFVEGIVTFQTTFGIVNLPGQTATFTLGSFLPVLVQGGYPNLAGLLLEEATDHLQLAGAIVPASIGYFGTWPVSVTWVPSQSPPFVVLGQSIPVAAPIVANQPITLTVSQPPESVTYP